MFAPEKKIFFRVYSNPRVVKKEKENKQPHWGVSMNQHHSLIL